MSDRILALKPFPSNHNLPNIKIVTTISKKAQQLKINYLLQGNLTQIILPPANNQSSRKNELWQTTCFEFFLAIFNAPEYREFNLSPTGDWNVYRFTKYRRGMIEDTGFSSFPFKSSQNKLTYILETQIDLSNIISGDTPLEIAVTAVIEDTNNNISYWAINHPGEQADFHRRDSFITI